MRWCPKLIPIFSINLYPFPKRDSQRVIWLGYYVETPFLTITGKKLLEKMGVETGRKVSIGKTTIQNLVNLYNAWKNPDRPLDPGIELIIGNHVNIPDDDVILGNTGKNQLWNLGLV